MQKVLDQSEGAKETADPATEEQTIKHQDAEHIIGEFRVGTSQRVLESAQWTGSGGGRAGVAVQARCTQIFGVALIDLAAAEALQIGIGQQCRIKLDDAALGGTVVRQPLTDGPFRHFCIFHINLTLYILCRWRWL